MKTSEIKTGETYVSKHKSGHCVFRRVMEILPTLEGEGTYVRFIDIASKEKHSILLESFVKWADKHVAMEPRESTNDPTGVLVSDLLGGDNPENPNPSPNIVKIGAGAKRDWGDADAAG